ncbi:hypothetical protein Q787_09605 [Ornithobacterium rhinotracheale H06-030791]|uniref:Uncharacterized protein n=1 Tax=Ornithobacterium rhinotracheale (strain ATCC 51463 / DSM 15997 / CCUG 23171 / CIP 104009 / LMG 9086) TaxID=867902 RepID=I4A2E1_ORNRL|nr:hypothetical protein Ornrh_1983 [Ornithobacterium rhinotracheale DSM 15997]AIQ00682.1 hypothetical protein Q785_09785 [Ornithobacterium rhinotracheale ORT-UMN 88]KGB66327.1 hypothetical protein Q787_09605 [Ornithobacterium rhinotracheale H06-030791]
MIFDVNFSLNISKKQIAPTKRFNPNENPNKYPSTQKSFTITLKLNI